MTWTMPKHQTRTLDKLGSLEELCRLIGYEINDTGEAQVQILARALSFGRYNRAYHFENMVFDEQCSDMEADEVIPTGVSNLRYFFPEPGYGLDSHGDNVRIYSRTDNPFP